MAGPLAGHGEAVRGGAGRRWPGRWPAVARRCGAALAALAGPLAGGGGAALAGPLAGSRPGAAPWEPADRSFPAGP